jgi:uncharacterized coiled-coil protein SlyX
MSESQQSELAARARRRARVRLARLEADLAYFQARIEILRDPVTMNQQAQQKAFTALYALFGKVAGASAEERAQP